MNLHFILEENVFIIQRKFNLNNFLLVKFNFEHFEYFIKFIILILRLL